VLARAEDGQLLLNQAVLDLLNESDRARFHQNTVGVASSLNGQSKDVAHIDWFRRLLMALQTIGQFLEAVTAAEPHWDPPTPFYAFDLPPFPTDALPRWQRDFVKAEATATQTPPDLAGMLTLSATAAACAKKVRISAKPGYTEPANVFTATALPPGNRKTQVFADVTAPLETWEANQAEMLGEAIAEAQTRYKILEQALQKAQSEAARAEPKDRERLAQQAVKLAHQLAATRVPVSSRLIADDVSPEHLATLLRDHGGRMAMMAPEGAVFDLMAGRYSGSGAPNFGVYLRGHAGDTLRVDRVGRPPEFISQPALTLGLAVQPDVLRGLMDKPGFRGRGLPGRFLYALPKSLLGSRDTDAPPMPPSGPKSLRRGMVTLLDLPFGIDDGGLPAPHVLRLSPEARAQIHAFEKWLEPQLAEFGALGHMTDRAGKLVGAAARIMGLLYMAAHVHNDEPWQIPIRGQTAEQAIRLTKYLIPHARAAYAETGSDPVVEQAQYVLGWLIRQDADTITKREIFEGTRGRLKRVAGLDPPLALLVDHGYPREQPQDKRPGPGRQATPSYAVNPLISSHDSQNSAEAGILG
jgi:replicative DNA helicase